MNNQNYKSYPSPFQMRQVRKSPIQEEIEKNIGTYNLTAVIEEDKDTALKLKNIPNSICFLCTLKFKDEIIGIGRGMASLNRMNRGLERGVRYSFGNSLIDSMVRGVKNLDALYFKTDNEEKDLEGRDSPAFYDEDDLPQTATDKQRNFLSKLVENCDEEEKEEYLSALASPYLSKFQCSELIQKLVPIK